MSSSSSPVLSRPLVRQLLAVVLLGTSDFDAFCLDYFADIHRDFDAGMDRTAKMNGLLLKADLTQIVKCLELARPALFSKYSGILNNTTSPIKRLSIEQAQAQCLAKYISDRNTLIQYKQDTTEVSLLIANAARALRRGASLNVGEVIDEQFELLRLIGEGTFADVWEARNLSPDDLIPETVAIKVLHGNHARDASRVRRFTHGASQMQGLPNANIVHIYRSTTEYEGFYYFVMEYVGGGDLHQAVLRDVRGAKRMAFLQAVLQAGTALQFAHERNLVHRDVKPQNILLDEQGNARLADFDLVLNIQDEANGRMTRTSMGLGTLNYAAPEQLENAAHVDCRADIYGLARTAMFVIYGGELPRKSIEDRHNFLQGLQVEAAIRGVLERATEWDREDRYQTIMELCASLQPLVPKNDGNSLRAGEGCRRKSLAEEVRDLEFRRMREALLESNGVIAAAARILQMPERTFYKKLREFKLVADWWKRDDASVSV